MWLLKVACRWCAVWFVFFGTYMLFAAKLSWQEAIAGSVIALFGAIAAIATIQAAELRYRPRLAWIWRLSGLPISVVRDCYVVGQALWWRVTNRRSVTGALLALPFNPGGDDAESAARRAIVTAGVSISPNTFVVAIDRVHGVLLVHQLVKSPEPPGNGDREWPL